MEPAEIVEPVETGQLEPAVVAALYVQYAEGLRYFLLGLVRNPELVQEVLQSTFVKALEVGRIDSEESRKAWLYRVAFNEAMAIRRRQAVGDRAQERLAQRGEPESAAPEEPLIRFETVEQVRAAIATLSPEQQQVVRLRMYENKTFAVIAAETGRPLGTVLSRMQAALRKLRDCLNNAT